MILLINVSYFMCMKYAITTTAFVVAMMNATGAASAPKCMLWKITVKKVITKRNPKTSANTLAGTT